MTDFRAAALFALVSIAFSAPGVGAESLHDGAEEVTGPNPHAPFVVPAWKTPGYRMDEVIVRAPRVVSEPAGETIVGTTETAD